VATGVVGWIGFGAVFSSLAAIGWRGLGVLCLWSAVPFGLLGTAWFLLAPGMPARRWRSFVWSRVLRDSASELLPFSQLGGFVIGARAAVLQGLTPTLASSTTVVDVTTELIAQIGFTGLGVAMLAARLGEGGAHGPLVGAGLVGLGLTAAGALALIAVQRRGAGPIERLVARFGPGAAKRVADFGRAVNALYDRPAALAWAVACHLAAWIASAAGVWLALKVAGVGVGLPAILALEALVCAVRSAAFVAPMGVGVQEATYALVGPLFGLTPEMSLAVSLLKRARDLVIGAPALLIWQAAEGRRLVGGIG
ncbi:MAG: flippase-like domain-containing protein, partial [Caulobacteraceae bacterium]|nr:flippase-like domain-containing protein [Caulobacteraceae bacterium]